MNEQKKAKPVRPFVLRHADAENRIFNAVNESAKDIPFCSLESILTNILHQVREHAKAEREAAAEDYDKQLEEYNKEVEKEEGTQV